VGLQLSDEALSGAVRLTQRYQRSDRLPRKALRLIGSAIAEKTYALQTGADDDAVLSADDVAGSFSAASGIPLSELDQDSASYAKELSGRLLTHVRGQDPAIEAVTSWLQLQSFGWMDPRRPRGRFLFLGPPGVGKSELANALASEVLHDKASIVVKNMAEYKGEGAKSRFMGADPGYVGFGTTETIYSKVSMRPYSVVVLDEIEKAHSSLADPLLSVLDGAAEDGQGRWVDFSQCIFVMTSNAIQAPADDRLDGETLRGLLREQGGVFTGPFVDRLDRIVLFQPLDRASLKAILDVLITKRRAAATRPLPASLDTPEVRGAILDTAVSQSGAASARGLERALARWLADQAAALLRTS
jgi:ATP-dependent Clp protease ATP-binding subunit ClpA